MRRTARWMVVGLLSLGVAPALSSCGGDKGASVDDLVTLKVKGFSVLLPGKAERTVQSAPTAAGPIEVVIYSVTKGETAYSANVVDVPAGVEFDLDGAVSGAASNVGGTVSDNTETTYQGFPARDARITGAKDKNGNKGTVFTRVILAGDRFYQLQYITGGGNVTSPGEVYPKMRDSLKIE